MKLSDLMERLGGTLVQGSLDHRLRGVHSPARATSADIVFAEDAGSAEEALAGKAGVVVLRAGLAPSYPPNKSVVETAQPRLWFARAGKLLRQSQPVGGIHPGAVIGKNVKLGEDVTIGPCAVIEENARIGARTRIEAGAVIGRGVRIGDYCHIYPRAVLYPGVTLGNWVVVHAGSVLGADGFGYVRNPANGAYTQFPQQGTLVIEDEVEIGANSTIDRGALAETRIRRGTKIDNLVHVGHNCDIGEDVILVALTGISGSSTVGKGAVLAGQVGIGDHAHVAPGVILGGQSGVFNGKTAAAEPGTVLYGTPARPLKQVLREQAVLARLASSRARSKRSPDDSNEPA
jgi:UDP-3-O-[3-hydroxymyristoyl] glucosamine N-acyltransferase